MTDASFPLMPDALNEWLEPDGLGGFAMGTAAGLNTRRYHGLLTTASTPPTGRLTLVNSVDAWAVTPTRSIPLSSHKFAPDVFTGDAYRRLKDFRVSPWPQWTFVLDDGARIEHEIIMAHGASVVVLVWRLVGDKRNLLLSVRPFLSGRNYHALHHANPVFSFDPYIQTGRVQWKPYGGVPAVQTLHNGRYTHHPEWYRSFQYDLERERGFDATEDLASPGYFRWDITRSEAVMIFAARGFENGLIGDDTTAERLRDRIREEERRRRTSFPSLLHRSADAYLVRRGEGTTILAGYPWFTDWGRDTFISLRGLCLATGRLEEAQSILSEWAGVVSEGMLPNYFPDGANAPEYNSVDASLWYVIAVHDFLKKAEEDAFDVVPGVRQKLLHSVEEILSGYSKGTRFGIRLDADGLIACGVPGVQLTWMDAKVGDWVITPRIGKPVEVQALWLNALWFAKSFSPRWEEPFNRGRAAFRNRFWNPETRGLFDVVDVDHKPGVKDGSVRPNQIFAAGGLPLVLLDTADARTMVETVESALVTPMGLRTLAPGSPGYTAHYQGGATERDGAYHQGTVWPWLVGPFVEAWLRVRGNSDASRREAHMRFLNPLYKHLNSVGLGHVSEIADAEPPFTPRGCPFQAWSLSELLRLQDGAMKGAASFAEVTE
jgi:predicted glycogen debranching enzyme